MISRSQTLGILAWLAVAACDDSDADVNDSKDASVSRDASATDAVPTTAVELKFEGRVGSERFACGGSYTGIGTSGATATAGDLRFFIHDVKLITASGDVPLALDTAEPWQSDRVALIDLEDKTGGCTSGTAATNDVARGRVPTGTYTGIAFTIGMPEDLNHVNADLAPAPLGSSKLQWDWTVGFVHFAAQLDSTKTTPAPTPDGGVAGADAGVTKVPPFFAHIGSALCAGSPADGGMASCQRKNRAVVRLTGFDPARDKIVVDLKKLLESSNIDMNTDNTIPGCMSGPNDPDCPPVFATLGLDFMTGAVATTPQKVFSIAPR